MVMGGYVVLSELCLGRIFCLCSWVEIGYRVLTFQPILTAASKKTNSKKKEGKLSYALWPSVFSSELYPL